MGDTERKKKKRTTSHSESEEDDRRSKKRSRTERDDKSKKKQKKKHHRSDKEKKSKEKRKSKHDKRGSRPVLNIKIEELTSDDYFSKNNEFATWLKEEKDVFFSDLASDSSRKLFSEFVEEWNSKTLELKYYEGIVTGPRSAHKWKIKQ